MLARPLIRLALPADAAAIAALSRDHIETGLPWTWRPERIANAIRDPDTNVAVAGPPDALAGFGIMIYREEDAHLVLFAVHPSRRRQGIGSALLGWLEDVARTAGCRRIRVEARRDNVAGRNFYSEHGYHEQAIERNRYHAGVDGVRLEKWLRPQVPGTPDGA
ncbi:GNAT family N-acetyltransferase [Ramlibacter sp. AN1133]|uniref:GNAT family N-acetyltransferase n=1 Tax=Ramlibacter sp. AN1133 TaxID=3133429 RepID=UPI0030BBF19E